MPATEKLTDRQVLALRTAVEKGGAWYARVSKMGGAWSRLCKGLADRGLLEEYGPHKVTEAGRAALAAHDEERLQKAYRRGDQWACEVMLARRTAA